MRANPVKWRGEFLVLYEITDAASIAREPQVTADARRELVLLRFDDRDEQQARAGDAVEREAMQQRQDALYLDSGDLGPGDHGHRVPAVARQPGRVRIRHLLAGRRARQRI